jgi:hypothetical protein
LKQWRSGNRGYARTAPLLGLACTPRTLDRHPTAEAIDAFTHELELELDIAEKPAVFGDLGGEVLVFDASHIKRFARLDSPFASPPISVPALYTHAAQRAHDVRARIG